MKNHKNKILITFFVLSLFSYDALSQFEITPYTGYMFGGRGYGYYVDVNIADGQNFGIMGDITLFPGVQVELMYNRMVSRATFWDYRENEQEAFDLASEYFMVGGLKDIDYGRIKPYGVFLLGIAAHSPQNANYHHSKDPFDVSNWTTPVGFYNGRIHGDFQTVDSPSPYGCYDMAGNVSEWLGELHKGSHLRLFYGGSMMDYGYNLRSFTENSGLPQYASFQVGFRCVR